MHNDYYIINILLIIIIIMQKARPNLLVLSTSEFAFSETCGQAEGCSALGDSPNSVLWDEQSCLQAPLYIACGHSRGSACLQGPEDWGFAYCAVKHMAEKGLHHCCSLGRYTSPLVKYVPNFKHKFQLGLIVSSASMYSLF